MIKALTASALAIILLTMLLILTTAHAALTVTADAETGDLSQVQSYKGYICCAYSVTVADNPVRAGKHSYKFDTRAGDPRVAGANHRAEVQVGGSVSGEYWYGWSTYIPADWKSAAQYHFITQWHVGTGGEPLIFSVDGVHVGIGHETGIYPDVKGSTLWQGDFSAVKGKWTDWVVHANWKMDASGYIQVWMNGKQVVDWHGVSVTPDGGWPYWKVGFNYYVAESHVMYADEMRMGDASANYAAVSPPAACPICAICPPAPVPIISCVTSGAVATCTGGLQ